MTASPDVADVGGTTRTHDATNLKRRQWQTVPSQPAAYIISPGTCQLDHALVCACPGTLGTSQQIAHLLTIQYIYKSSYNTVQRQAARHLHTGVSDRCSLLACPHQ